MVCEVGVLGGTYGAGFLRRWLIWSRMRWLELLVAEDLDVDADLGPDRLVTLGRDLDLQVEQHRLAAGERTVDLAVIGADRAGLSTGMLRSRRADSAAMAVASSGARKRA